MSGGFSFPPPPPPPPRAAPSQDFTQNQYGSQSQNHGAGRGRGRGGFGGQRRGQGNNRGRGNFQSRGQHQGYGNFGAASQPPQQMGLQNSYGITGLPMNPYMQQQPFQQLPQQQSPQCMPIFPPGAYVNPAMTNGSFGQGYGNASFNTQQFQHGSFQPMSHGLQQNGFHEQPPPMAPGSSGSSSPPPSYAGQKRKRDFPRGPQRGPNMPKVQVAPAVPTFGLPISLPPKPSFSNNGVITQDTKKPHASNQLGLTPATEDPEESEDDANEEDVGEEFLLADLDGKLMFEHNGSVSTLNSAAEVKAWIEERKEKWPTKQRMVEKQQEARKRGEERKRIQAEAVALRKPLDDQRAQFKRSTQGGKDESKTDGGHGTSSKKRRKKSDNIKEGQLGRPAETELEAAKRSLAEQMKKVEELQAQIARSEAKTAQALPASGAAALSGTAPPTEENSTQDGSQTGNKPRAFKANPIDSVVLGTPEYKPSVLAHSALIPHGTAQDTSQNASSPSESSDASSDVSSDISSDSDSDSDAPPEEASSKVAPILTPQQRPCFAFVNTGYCKFGERCKYRHELPERGAASTLPPKRETPRAKEQSAPDAGDRVKPKSLYQRLVEQEQDAEDRLALQAIKHLGAAGFFNQQTAELETYVVTVPAVNGPAAKFESQKSSGLDQERDAGALSEDEPEEVPIVKEAVEIMDLEEPIAHALGNDPAEGGLEKESASAASER